MSTARGLGVVTAIITAVSLIMVAPRPAAIAAPIDDQHPISKPRSSAPSVRIPASVRTAVADGPTTVLVGYDAGAALTRARRSGEGSGRASRVAATRAVAATLDQTKDAAVAAVGGGLQVRRDFDHLPAQLVRVETPAALARLAAAPGVTAIGLPRHGTVTASTPEDQALIRQPEAASAGYTGAGVRVAVIDTGADWTLPGSSDAFGDCTLGPGSDGCRIDRLVDVSRTGARDVDPDHHGTQVAAIVAATAPAAHLDVYNVFAPTASGLTQFSETDLLSALNQVTADAAARNVRAVNLSLGLARTFYTADCTADASVYSAAFANLRALGVVPVASAGNAAEADGRFRDGIGLPACATGAVRVGAVYDHDFDVPLCPSAATQHHLADEIACFSQTGENLSMLAPGVRVNAAGITASGTSQAAPHVAGAVADLASVRPRATAQQIVRALTGTGPLITDSRPAVPVSRHRLDIAAAAEALDAPDAELDDPACAQTALPVGDDDSSAAVPLPFVANFFGARYNALYVNTNGNITFREPKAGFTPQPITADTPPIIAPFLADVDTRGAGSGRVGHGTTSYQGRPAFCVDWTDVGYFSAKANKINSFQLLLVDRSDVGAGDFDIVMNYRSINWETGDASGGVNGVGGSSALVGFSAGDGNPAHAVQVEGSLTRGALLDTNPRSGLVNTSDGSEQLGRRVFGVRNGLPPGQATPLVTVTASPAHPVVGEPVTFTATLNGADQDPRGTITLRDQDGDPLPGCDQTEVADRTATCTSRFVHAADATELTAFYSGDGTSPAAFGRLSLPVDKGIPVISWAQPTDLSYPSALGATELNAVANVAGTFRYTVHATGEDARGAVLPVGAGQLVDAKFTPDQAEDYTSATAQMIITELPTPVPEAGEPGGDATTPADKPPSAPVVGVELDDSVSADQRSRSGRIGSPTLTTSEDDELLMAFVAADGSADEDQQVSQLSGGGLSWQLVTRSDPGYGTVEVWQASAPKASTPVRVSARLSQPGFGSSITLAAFRGAGPSATNASTASGPDGTPLVHLATSTSGGRVWLVGHHWSRAETAVPRANQALAHSWADDDAGDSFWVQYDESATSAQSLTLGNTTPDEGPWQLAAVEIPPARGDR